MVAFKMDIGDKVVELGVIFIVVDFKNKLPFFKLY
jgi:hypothetical protein